MPRPRGRKCGTVSGYRGGCRCESCLGAKREANRAYVALVKERDGLTPTEKIRGQAAERACSECGASMFRTRLTEPLCTPCRTRARRAVWVPQQVRLAIYERDGWTCGICAEPVHPGLPNSSPWQATLDHITPRSRGGSDDPSNLRLAHRWCNAVRSNRAALTIEELAG